MATTTPAPAPTPAAVGATPPRAAGTGWWVAVYLVTVAAVVTGIVVRLGGRFVYVLDDAAIHLSVAEQLVHHGTWGVTAGHFQSASSSPLWTLLVAAGVALVPGPDAWVPLILNVVAGVGVVVVLARNQIVLRPGRGRWLDAAAVLVAVTLVLFLPGLAVVGMEHTLHSLLVLGAVVLVQRRARDGDDTAGLPRWLPYALLALATLARFETAFVAAGLAAGLACDAVARGGDVAGRARAVAGRMVAVLAAAAVPLALFAAANKALGGGLLPNSVLAKGQAVGSGKLSAGGLGPGDIVGRLASDPLLAALAAFALGYVLLAWGSSARHLVTAVTVLVATMGQVALADVGWFARYQAYLLVVGLYLVLGVIGDLPAGLRRRAVLALVAVTLLFTPAKARLLVRAPLSADATYGHLDQAGRFLARYYDGQPVATDQLGYISLLHDGPLTDFAGLGDYEVLRRIPTRDRLAAFHAELARERGFRVAVVPDTSAMFASPHSWVLAGQLRIDGPYDGPSRRLDFFATVPAEVRPLQAHLRDFARSLPPQVTLVLNGFAEMQADAL